MIYYIRYNVAHKQGTSPLKWRVFQNEDKFWMTNSVVINVRTWTGDTTFNDDEFKYSIYCDGTLTSCDENEIIIS